MLLLIATPAVLMTGAVDVRQMDEAVLIPAAWAMSNTVVASTVPRSGS